MQPIHVWPESPTCAGGLVETGAVVEWGDGPRWRLSYRLPAAFSLSLAADGDPYVLALLFAAMARGQDLRLHGDATPSLLRNLEEFQAVWHAWRPQCYAPIEVVADREAECARAPKVLVAFSGGLDSCYTVHRHARGAARRRALELSDGLMVHGFDIRLDQEREFEAAALGAKRTLASVGLGLIPLATNLRELRLPWEEVHGAALASCMALLKGAFGTGLIGPTWPYDRPRLSWGSNPLTDRLLGSDSFQVVHDDASVSRLGRIREIAGWPEALANLRVCWESGLGDRNCCVCRKCVRTILGFLALGFERPPAFASMPSRSDILATRLSGPQYLPLVEEILAVSKANGFERTEWHRALRTVVRRYSLRARFRNAGRAAADLLRGLPFP